MDSKNTLLILCIFFSLLTGTQATSEIYKWVDEKGKVHFSDQKMNTKKQETVELNVVESQWSRYDIDVETRNVLLTEEEHQRIRDDINAIYEFYDRVLFFDFYRTVPVSILVLENKDAYQHYLQSELKLKRYSNSLGLYLPKENEIVVYVQPEREHTFLTIKHETSHAIVDTITPYAPAWLNEGLAEQMETLEREGEALTIVPHPYNQPYVSKLAQKHRLMSVEEFLKLPSADWRNQLANGGGYLQAQSGQFVNFLLSTPPDRSFVVRLIHNFERGDRTLSYYLVDENYIGGIRTLQQNWYRWLKKDTYPTLTL